MDVKPYEGNEPFLFVSYAHLDTEVILPMLELLQRAGLRFWYDDAIHSGDDWRMKIEQRLVDSAGILAFISEHSIASKNCRKEIFFAEDTDKAMHLVRLDKAPYAHGLAMTLGNMNYVAYQGEPQPVVEKLMRVDDLGPCKVTRRDGHHFWRPQAQWFGQFLTAEDCEEANRALEDPWGPERPFYKEDEYPAKWALNSVANHRTYGNERSFVTIRRVGTKRWLREIDLVPDERYEVRVVYHVHGDPTRNASGVAVADLLKASVIVPERVLPQRRGTIRAALHAAWPQPGPLAPDDEIWSTVRLTVHDQPLYLSFVPATAKLHTMGKQNGTVLSTHLFDEQGIVLGFNKLTGSLPSGDEFAGYITFEFVTRAHTGDCTLLRTASLDGEEGTFVEGFLEASPGQTITFKNSFANVSDADLTRVTFKDQLPPAVALTPGTTILRDSVGHTQQFTDRIAENGYNTGRYGRGVQATLTYQAVVPASSRPHNYFTLGSVYHDGGRRASNLIVHVPGTDEHDPLLLDDPEHDERYASFLATAPRAGWGPRRDTFTMEHPAPHAAFNSITNNNVVGDERNFVRVARWKAHATYVNRLQVVPGYLYEVYIGYDNAAAPNAGEAGMARDVRLRVTFPSTLGALEHGRVEAVISSSTTNPPKVWSSSTLWAAQPVTLRYVSGSAKLYNGRHRGLALDTSIFGSEGTLLGTDTLDGLISCADRDASGHVILLLAAEERSL